MSALHGLFPRFASMPLGWSAVPYFGRVSGAEWGSLLLPPELAEGQK
jgi:hypothetical protein